MEINIKNAFKEAVKFSLSPCIEKYRMLTEKNQQLFLQTMKFFLERPLFTTILFSALFIVFIISLSISFIILLGVLVIAIVILLFEGFVFIVVLAVLSMIVASVTLFIMIIFGIKYTMTIIHNLDED
ncbi:uncharacterized protein LOC124631364 [Helicoverpa zea]|uniref:uncharacterized protein LOC124631364 n=1 Tax=Helicoverpa zea TaxID=7113 RepID=UPI001F598463|nr:uncharacterized protein LOC124631364 [Helicoverpa zea]